MYCVLDCCGDSLGQVSNTTFTVYRGCIVHHTPPDISGVCRISDSLGLDFAKFSEVYPILSFVVGKYCFFVIFFICQSISNIGLVYTLFIGSSITKARQCKQSDRKSTRLNSSHPSRSRMPSSA